MFPVLASAFRSSESKEDISWPVESDGEKDLWSAEAAKGARVAVVRVDRVGVEFNVLDVIGPSPVHQSFAQDVGCPG